MNGTANEAVTITHGRTRRESSSAFQRSMITSTNASTAIRSDTQREQTLLLLLVLASSRVSWSTSLHWASVAAEMTGTNTAERDMENKSWRRVA